MENFINPAAYGSMNTSHTSKKVRLSSYPNSVLVSPYNGVTMTVKDKDCLNGIRIKHFYDEQILYSTFCNVGRIFVSSGDSVRQGQTIGQFSGDDIIFYVENDNDRKVDVPALFISRKKDEYAGKTPKKVKDNKDGDEEEKYDGKPKNKKTTTTTTTQKDYNPKRYGDEIPNPVLDLFLSPLGAVGSVLGKPKTNPLNLREDIERIKKIMK